MEKVLTVELKLMKIVLITDTFPPLRSSGAIQLWDLSQELSRQGHRVTVLLASQNQHEPWLVEKLGNIELLRLKVPRIKNVTYFRRTLGEFIMPFAMLHNLRKSPLVNKHWDGVVFYSPSIFHGPLVSKLKKNSRCKSYLILRDIFPDWAVDIGLMGYGLPYLFFHAVARYQYSVADFIGVQSQGNKVYFKYWKQQLGRKLEVLQNWLDKPAQGFSTISVNETSLRGRNVLLYAGNMGIAQSLEIFLDLAQQLHSREDVGFLFVGRGSEVARLNFLANKRQLNNVLFYEEIHPNEIPGLCSQCVAGIVALDPRHRSHNIPGKFLTYMQNGLPVLANINKGNDLAKMIREQRVGQVCESNQVEDLVELVNNLLNQIKSEDDLSYRCRDLFDREFAVEIAAQKIVSAFSTEN